MSGPGLETPKPLTAEEVERLIMRDRQPQILGTTRVLDDPYDDLVASMEPRIKERATPRGIALLGYLSTAILVGVSMIFNVELFVSRSTSDAFSLVIMGLLGGGFDVAKTYLWVEGLIERRRVYIAIALAYAVISLLAATIATFGTTESADLAARNASYEVVRLEKRVEELDREIEVETARIESGSVQYRTDANDTRAARAALVMERASVEAKIAELKALGGAARKVGFLPSSLVSDEANERIEFYFLLFRAFLVEVGGLATTAALAIKWRDHGKKG